VITAQRHPIGVVRVGTVVRDVGDDEVCLSLWADVHHVQVNRVLHFFVQVKTCFTCHENFFDEVHRTTCDPVGEVCVLQHLGAGDAHVSVTHRRTHDLTHDRLAVTFDTLHQRRPTNLYTWLLYVVRHPLDEVPEHVSTLRRQQPHVLHEALDC